MVLVQRKSASKLSQNWQHVFETLNWRSSKVSRISQNMSWISLNLVFNVFFSNLYDDADPSNAALVGPCEGRFRIKPAQISSPALRFHMLLRRQFAPSRIFENRPQILASAVWGGGMAIF